MPKREKINNNPKKKGLMVYVILTICIVMLCILFASKSYETYHSFKNHRGYFKTTTNPLIESWMTPHTVLRHFNLTSTELFGTLNVTNSSFNFAKPISTICSDKKVNCTAILLELNTLAT